MELPPADRDQTKKRRGLGRCRHFFWLGVAFDAVGATVLLTGVFADLLFYDLLLYLGSIIIFLSLLWWVFWYSANIELTSEEPMHRPYHLPSATTLEILSQTISNRFTFSVGSVSNTFMRMRHRRRQPRRRFLPESPSVSMTVTGSLGQLDQEDQVKDRMDSAKESEVAQEAVKSIEEVCSLGPSAGPLGPKASLPQTHQVQPQLPPSSLDQALTPAILASKSLPIVPLASMSQPVLILTSKSQQPVVTLASRNQPDVPMPSTSQPVPVLTSKNQPVVLLPSTSQPTAVTLASRSQPAVPLSSTSQPLIVRPYLPESASGTCGLSEASRHDCRLTELPAGACGCPRPAPESFSSLSDSAATYSGSPSPGSGHPSLSAPASAHTAFSDPDGGPSGGPGHPRLLGHVSHPTGHPEKLFSAKD